MPCTTEIREKVDLKRPLTDPAIQTHPEEWQKKKTQVGNFGIVQTHVRVVTQGPSLPTNQATNPSKGAYV